MTGGDPPREPPVAEFVEPQYSISDDSLDEARNWLASTTPERAEAFWLALLVLGEMRPEALKGYHPRELQDLENPQHNILRLDDETLMIWRFTDVPYVIDIIYIGQDGH